MHYIAHQPKQTNTQTEKDYLPDKTRGKVDRHNYKMELVHPTKKTVHSMEN